MAESGGSVAQGGRRAPVQNLSAVPDLSAAELVDRTDDRARDGPSEAMRSTATELDEDYCWAVLHSGSFGRVALSRHAMPVIVPVRYTIREGGVRFRPAGAVGIAGALIDSVVAFQADGFDDEICGAWSVHLVGRVTDLGGANFELRPSVVQGHWLTFFRVTPMQSGLGWSLRSPGN